MTVWFFFSSYNFISALCFVCPSVQLVEHNTPWAIAYGHITANIQTTTRKMIIFRSVKYLINDGSNINNGNRQRNHIANTHGAIFRSRWCGWVARHFFFVFYVEAMRYYRYWLLLCVPSGAAGLRPYSLGRDLSTIIYYYIIANYRRDFDWGKADNSCT